VRQPADCIIAAPVRGKHCPGPPQVGLSDSMAPRRPRDGGDGEEPPAKRVASGPGVNTEAQHGPARAEAAEGATSAADTAASGVSGSTAGRSAALEAAGALARFSPNRPWKWPYVSGVARHRARTMHPSYPPPLHVLGGRRRADVERYLAGESAAAVGPLRSFPLGGSTAGATTEDQGTGDRRLKSAGRGARPAVGGTSGTVGARVGGGESVSVCRKEGGSSMGAGSNDRRDDIGGKDDRKQ